MSMYIRVKRNKTTYFIQCDPTESVLNVKEKLQSLIDQPANDQRLILLGSGEVLEDSKSLADQKVENDSVVALTLRKGASLTRMTKLVEYLHKGLKYFFGSCSNTIAYLADDNEFEDVNIARPNDPFYQSRDGDGSNW